MLSPGATMQFNSVQYLVLVLAVSSVYGILRKRGQNALLLLASYVFYAAWDWRFLSLLWISTAADFLVGRAMGGTSDTIRRRRLLAVSLIVNLGLLATFKYFDFFSDSLAAFRRGGRRCFRRLVGAAGKPRPGAAGGRP